MKYETYGLGSPRPPRQTGKVKVRWKVTRAGTSLVCECGWTSPPTGGLDGTRLLEHVEAMHDPNRRR